jgi:hypothetical protein
MDRLRRIYKNLTYSQMWFVAILIPMSCLAPLLYNYCDNFSKERRMERPDYDSHVWSDFSTLLYFVPIMHVAKYIVRKLSTPFFVAKLSRKYSGETLNLKIEK